MIYPSIGDYLIRAHLDDLLRNATERHLSTARIRTSHVSHAQATLDGCASPPGDENAPISGAVGGPMRCCARGVGIHVEVSERAPPIGRSTKPFTTTTNFPDWARFAQACRVPRLEILFTPSRHF
jgi:hypothetical protein